MAKYIENSCNSIAIKPIIQSTRIDILPKKTYKWAQVQETMLNITKYKGNANQNYYSEMLPITVSMAMIKKKKRQEIANAGEELKKVNSCAIYMGV